MKWYVVIKKKDSPMEIRRFDSRQEMLDMIIEWWSDGTEIICVWTEPK